VVVPPAQVISPVLAIEAGCKKQYLGAGDNWTAANPLESASIMVVERAAKDTVG
jgi:hypothetical protein